ncbi:hypothetical protein [Pedobacter nyackensis]|uniref:Natural product n=1 Tax=Pedobacter nyackensis TaxID=475255 RepID=A0A1W2AKG2_9SPHI|nr:hypothetical protein [Pedobacter nyackensis]SMC61166.1 hypothetical protein SAMN04488101_101702 [Pedobacter nyackensis]
MRKLQLNSIRSRGEVLSRAQLKKILGGSGSGDGSGSESCVGTFFLITAEGCGYTTCTNAENMTDCLCKDVIQTPHPCGYA